MISLVYKTFMVSAPEYKHGTQLAPVDPEIGMPRSETHSVKIVR